MKQTLIGGLGVWTSDMLGKIADGFVSTNSAAAEGLTTADGSTANDLIHRRSHSSSKTRWLKAMGMDETWFFIYA